MNFEFKKERSPNAGLEENKIEKKDHGPMVLVETRHYEGQYPDIPEFQNPIENTVRVSQDEVYESTEKPLISEGFSKCLGIAIKDETDKKALVFHLNDLTFSYKNNMVKVLKDIGGHKNKAYIILGSSGRSTEIIKDELKEIGINDIQQIDVNTKNDDGKNYHMGFTYDFHNNRIYIDNRKNNTLLVYEEKK